MHHIYMHLMDTTMRHHEQNVLVMFIFFNFYHHMIKQCPVSMADEFSCHCNE